MSTPNDNSKIERSCHWIKPGGENIDKMPNSQLHEFDSASSNILNRVTSSVSGLFSNKSWSGWLKSPSSFNAKDVESQHHRSASRSPDMSSSSFFNQLYPEEGAVDIITSGMQMQGPNYVDVSSEKHFTSSQSKTSPFKRGASIISSTPALSSRVTPKINGDTSLCNHIISKPGTSLENQALSSQEDSLDLLSFATHHAEYTPLNFGGITNKIPSGRKRIRETVMESAEECGARSTKRGRSAPSPPQIFTEEEKITPRDVKKSKRPRFSVSSYGSPFYKQRKAPLEEDDPTFSIFYPGKVMYGGAANHQKKKQRTIVRKVLPRTPASASSVDDSTLDGGLSTAAKRILNCIDKISTPLSNSKRILPFASPRQFSWDSSPFVADFHKHRPPIRTKEENSTPPVMKLLTPSKVSINKKLSTFLEESSVKRTRRTTNMNLISDADNVKSCLGKTSTSSEQFLSETPETHKMKPFEVSEKGTNVVNAQIEGNDSKFKISQLKSKEATPRETVFTTSQKNLSPISGTSFKNDFQYKFSSPEIVFDSCEKEEFSSKGIEFRFSLPLHGTEILFNPNNEANRNLGSNSFVSCEIPKIISGSSAPAKHVDAPLVNVSSGNWGEDFKAPGESLSSNTFSAVKVDNPCIASVAAKPKQETHQASSLSGWGDAFRPKEGSWDCESCLLQNNASASKCACCEAPKPVTELTPASNKTATISETSSKSGFVGSWGNAFKIPKDSWDCEQCLVMNDSKSQSCVCCMASKPKSASQTNGTNGDPTSVSCSNSFWKETPKLANVNPDFTKHIEGASMCLDSTMTTKSPEDKYAGCKSSLPTIASNSLLSSETSSGTTTTFSDVFKSKDEWECETCLVRNKSISPKCICCETPRAQLDRSLLSEALTGNFKFGVITKDAKEAPTVVTSSLSQTINNTETTKGNCFGGQNTSMDLPKFEFSNSSAVVKNVSQSSNNFGFATTSTLIFTPQSEPKVTAITNSNLVSQPVQPVEPKPAFQFPSVTTQTQKVNSTKLEFPKLAAGSTTSQKSPEGSKNSQPSVNPMTFSFFGKNNKASPSTTFTPPNSTTTTLQSTASSSTFVFGQPSGKPLSTGFNFGETSTKPASSFNFSFGNTETVNKFSQSQTNRSEPTKPEDRGPPSFLNIETPKASSFNATSAGGPQRRVIKKAFRRNK